MMYIVNLCTNQAHGSNTQDLPAAASQFHLGKSHKDGCKPQSL